MNNDITRTGRKTFESVRGLDDQGHEFWLARDLSQILDYSEYRHFLPVMERARGACLKSKQKVKDHFEDVLEMAEIGSGARRQLSDIKQIARNQTKTSLGRDDEEGS